MPKQLENGVLIMSKAVHDPDLFMKDLMELAWIRHEKVPRCEYYYNLDGLPYSYGKPEYARTYESQPHDAVSLKLLHRIAEQVAHTQYDTCFLNRYLDHSDSLQWHSDNSPEMDDEKPIVILTLGQEREIWFRKIPGEEKCVACNGTGIYDSEYQPPCGACKGTGKSEPEAVTKVILPHGSACIMPPGFQDTHQHRIPKGGHCMGGRISLTYRGYVR
jgi:alkylated DNA repair dioxygenase AlkB